MHHRTLALALALVTALIGTATLPAMGQESPAPSASPSAEATIGGADDLALVVATVAPDELAVDLSLSLGADLPPEPLALDLAESPYGGQDEPDAQLIVEQLEGVTTLLFPYAAELAALDPSLARLLDAIPATTDLEAQLLARLADELAEGPLESGQLGFLSARVVGPGADGPLPPAAESVGASFDGSELGTKLAGMSDVSDGFGQGAPREASATGNVGDAEVTVGMEIGSPGSDVGVSVTIKQGVTEVGSRWRGRLEGDPCPDADGNVDVSYRLTVEDTGTAGPGISGSRTMTAEGTATGSVNDAAVLTAVEFSGTTSDRFTSPSRAAWVEAKVAGTAGLGDSIDHSPSDRRIAGTYGVSRASSQATAADRAAAESSAKEVYRLVLGILGMWERDWRAGRCVKVNADIPATVQPSEQHGFDVHVVHKDGSELDAPVDATFSGKQSLDPLRIEHAPGRLTYTAGDQKGDSGTIELVSTSHRGIGKLKKDVKVEQQGFRMEGGADELVVDAVVCDITQPFTVKGSGITLDFTPNAADPKSGGTYSYRGDFKKFSVAGKGTYTVKLTDKGGGSIVAKGKGKVTGPLGTFSSGGTEKYDLTPTPCE